MVSNMHGRQTLLNASMTVIVPSNRTAATCRYVMYWRNVAWNAHSLSMFKCKLKRCIRTE